MQTQWPGLGPSFLFSSLDSTAGDGPQPNAAPSNATASPIRGADAIARPWWSCGTTASNDANPLGNLFGPSNAAGAGIFALVSGLIGALQQLVAAFVSQNAPRSIAQPGQQRFENVDVSSTGDPHIAEVGTTEGPGGEHAVDVRWDSMEAHDDLVHSNAIAGGYRVSTAVTQPGANGVTFNNSATVHTNFDQDSVTMQRDGAFSISDAGNDVKLAVGQSITLSGGETVIRNPDGSLTVGAQSADGGTIATTLRATGQGVDVTTHAHEIALGGDAVMHGAHRSHGGHVHPPHPPAEPARD